MTGTLNRSDLILATILFLGLQLLDILTTSVGLAIGAVEQNPVMASVLFLRGELGMYLAKLLLEVSVVVVVWKLDAKYNGQLRMGLWLGCVIMAGVVGSNLGVLKMLGVI